MAEKFGTIMHVEPLNFIADKMLYYIISQTTDDRRLYKANLQYISNVLTDVWKI